LLQQKKPGKISSSGMMLMLTETMFKNKSLTNRVSSYTKDCPI
jgi:hypothetical protein